MQERAKKTGDPFFSVSKITGKSGLYSQFLFLFFSKSFDESGRRAPGSHESHSRACPRPARQQVVWVRVVGGDESTSITPSRWTGANFPLLQQLHRALSRRRAINVPRNTFFCPAGAGDSCSAERDYRRIVSFPRLNMYCTYRGVASGVATHARRHCDRLRGLTLGSPVRDRVRASRTHPAFHSAVATL